jgi:hypothetical protein
MHTHPHIVIQLGIDRQRDRLARAEQQRLARQLRHLSRARRAERPEPVFLLVTRLRSILSTTH